MSETTLLIFALLFGYAVYEVVYTWLYCRTVDRHLKRNSNERNQ